MQRFANIPLTCLLYACKPPGRTRSWTLLPLPEIRSMKLAYLVNSYPLPSQTFIRREIHALERMGWQVHRFAM